MIDLAVFVVSVGFGWWLAGFSFSTCLKHRWSEWQDYGLVYELPVQIRRCEKCNKNQINRGG